MEEIYYFPYSQEDIDCLKNKDKRLAAAIELVGPIQRQINPDLFSSLVYHIVGQQISVKAQITIWNRMLDHFGSITPHSVAALSKDTIQSCGITMKKAGYIKDIAEKIACGDFDLQALYNCDDTEVCRRLCALPGIGVWTAEMLMLFSMARPNIFSYGDLVMHRGLRMLYHHRNVDRPLFEKYRRRFTPYCSLASFYIWAIASDDYGYRDYAPTKK